MKRNDIILLVSAIIYDYLFYAQAAGVNFLIFTIALLVVMNLKDNSLLKNKAWLATAIGALLTATSVALYGNTLSVLANILSLSLSASFAMSRNSSLIFAVLHSLYSYLSSLIFVFIDYLKKKKEMLPYPSPLYGRVLVTTVPIIVTLVFFFLYREANPIFKEFTRNLKFDFVTTEWIQFTVIGFFLLYAFFNQRQILQLVNIDQNGLDNLERDKLSNIVALDKIHRLLVENKLGLVLFFLLNGLLLVVNLLDAQYLLFNQKLPEGITYSSFVHQGIYTLIVSIILAIAIILYFFRGSLNFYDQNKTLKWLTFLWIIQNGVLIISSVAKNNLYVYEYSLTYKRIGVYVYLLLSFIGLTTTFIKILSYKTNWFLFRKNAWAFYGILIIGCFINWNQLITIFNINHSRDLDRHYLLSLAPSSLPYLLFDSKTSVDRGVGYDETAFNQKLENEIREFKDETEKAGWQSWNYENSTVYQELINHEK